MAIDAGKYRMLLRQREARLLADLRNTNGDLLDDATPDVEDFTDRATSDEIKDTQFAEQSAESAELDEVRDALARLDEGSFGLCEACGRQIETARLEAIPWTRFCIDDARARETDTVPSTL